MLLSPFINEELEMPRDQSDLPKVVEPGWIQFFCPQITVHIYAKVIESL